MTPSTPLPDLHSPSRYADLNGWRSFATPILLPGWEERSVWGFDQCHTEFFGCLWPNGDDRPLRVTDSDCGCPRGRTPGSIVAAVHDELGDPPLTVIEAMGILDPAARLRSDEELAARIEIEQRRGSHRDVIDGAVAALEWARGLTSVAPGSIELWTDGQVTAAHVDAQRQLLSGYLDDVDHLREAAFNSGAEDALRWAIDREDAI